MPTPTKVIVEKTVAIAVTDKCVPGVRDNARTPFVKFLIQDCLHLLFCKIMAPHIMECDVTGITEMIT